MTVEDLYVVIGQTILIAVGIGVIMYVSMTLNQFFCDIHLIAVNIKKESDRT
jgi:uncharacterized UPF0146 family protein